MCWKLKVSIFLPLFGKNLLITIKATLSERRLGWKETRIKNKSFQPEYDIDYTPVFQKSKNKAKPHPKKCFVWFFRLISQNIILPVWRTIGWSVTNRTEGHHEKAPTEAPRLHRCPPFWWKKRGKVWEITSWGHGNHLPKKKNVRKGLGMSFWIVWRKFTQASGSGQMQHFIRNLTSKWATQKKKRWIPFYSGG